MKCPDPIKVLRKFVASFSADGQFNSRTSDVSLPDLLKVAKTSLRGRKGQRVLFVTPDDAKCITVCLQGQAERIRKSVQENAMKRYREQWSPESKNAMNELAHRADQLAIQLLRQEGR